MSPNDIYVGLDIEKAGYSHNGDRRSPDTLMYAAVASTLHVANLCFIIAYPAGERRVAVGYTQARFYSVWVLRHKQQAINSRPFDDCSI